MNRNTLKYLFLFSALLIGAFLAYFQYFLPKQTQEKAERLAHKKKEILNAQLENARMQSYLQHYEEALLKYRQLLEAQPNNNEIKIDMATILYYQQKYSQALDLLQTIPLEQRNSKVNLLLGNLELAEKNLTAAESLYRKYLQENPNDKEATLKLAEVLSWQKNYEEAMRLYKQLLLQDPHNIQLRREYAKVLIWKGNFEEGANELKKTLAEENSFSINKKNSP